MKERKWYKYGNAKSILGDRKNGGLLTVLSRKNKMHEVPVFKYAFIMWRVNLTHYVTRPELIVSYMHMIIKVP